MKIISYLLLPAVAILFNMPSEAQVKKQNNSFILEGKVQPSSLHDTVFMELKREFVFHNLGEEYYKGICDKNGYFKFTIDKIFHPAGVLLYLKKEDGQMVKKFYAEPGDSIFISITRKDNEYAVTYSGRGFEKLNCQSAIDAYKATAFRTFPHPTGDKGNDTVLHNLPAIFRWNDTLESSLLHLLSHFKNSLSIVMYGLLKSDIRGWSRKDRCLLLAMYARQADAAQRRDLEKLFFPIEICPKDISAFAAVYSDEYIEFLLRRCQDRLLFLNSGGQYTMKALYKLIVRDYNGIIRNRVIVRYLLSGNTVSNDEYEYCLSNALKIIHTPLYKLYVSQQLQRLKKGSAGYSFSLPDSSGKLISLSDFKGRVVFMDFWFTGCYSCIRLAEVLEKAVVKRYPDSSVAFISICIDADKNKWMKSVASGKYTNSQTINLFTAGKGMEHPLVKYYNIQGCPYTMVLDRKGNIYSAKPPRDGRALCALLDKALQ